MLGFTEMQLCCGFNLIFSNGFTDSPFAFYQLTDVNRCVKANLSIRLWVCSLKPNDPPGEPVGLSEQLGTNALRNSHLYSTIDCSKLLGAEGR